MHFFFAYYPYICITLLLAGLAFRYVTDPGDWNARSSEIFEKTWLRRGSIIFHYAIILSFFGHIVGLLTPDSVMHALRISMEAHTVVAVGMGMILLFSGLVRGGFPVLLLSVSYYFICTGLPVVREAFASRVGEEGRSLALLLKGLTAVFPDFSRFDFKALVTQEAGLPVLQPLAVDFLLLGLYLAIVLWAAALVYQRRDLQ